jgi:HlyD family secretion protein
MIFSIQTVRAKAMQASTIVLMTAAGLSSLIGAGCGSHAQPAVVSAGNAPEPVGVSCLGRITPGDRAVKVSAPPDSIVKELRVRRGSRVAPGQELAVLRNYDVAAASLAEAASEVAVAESEVAQTKAGEKPATIAAQAAAAHRQETVLRSAETDLARKKELFEGGLLPKSEFETSQAAVDTARHDLDRQNELLRSLHQVRSEDVEVAEKKLAQAQAKAAYAKSVLEQNRILAPAAGTVLEIHAYPGEPVSQDGLLDLGDLSRMFVDAEVYVSDIPRVHQGASATITGEGFSGTLSGKVVEILRQASGNQLFPNDALTAADKRVLVVRIRLEDAGPVQHLSNSQVSVRIEP